MRVAMTMGVGIFMAMFLTGMLGILSRPVFLPGHVFFAIDPDIYFRSRNAAPNDARKLEPRSQIESRHGLFQQLRRHSGVNQSTEKHISANTRKAV